VYAEANVFFPPIADIRLIGANWRGRVAVWL
jgi:hypothetical protein